MSEKRVVSATSMAHGLDRATQWSASFAGGQIGYMTAAEGTVGFFEEMSLYKPTFFVAMSQFWQVLAAIAEQLGEEKAIRLSKEQPVLWSQLSSSYLATRKGRATELLLYNVASEELGNSIEKATTGGAHTPDQVKKFVSAVVGTEILDAYGSTEFTGISVNGEINGSIDLKLKPVVRLSSTGQAETIYSPDDQPHPRGEILVRRKDGKRTTYWKNCQLNSSTWSNGWYHTGDVGLLNYVDTFDEDGNPRLRIIDRVKTVEEVYYKGDSKWIKATELESSVYGSIEQIDHCVITSPDRNRDGIMAIVALSEAVCLQWNLDRNAAVPMGSEQAQAYVPQALSTQILDRLQAKGQEAGLKPYEIPAVVVIEWRPWAEVGPNNTEGQLTLTGKVKRGFVKEMYRFLSNHLYTLHEQANLGSVDDALEENKSRDVELEACGERLLRMYQTTLGDTVFNRQQVVYFQADTVSVTLKENEWFKGLLPGQVHTFRPGQPGYLYLEEKANWLRGPPIGTLLAVTDDELTGRTYTFAMKKGIRPGKATLANQSQQKGGRVADVKFTTSDGQVVDKKTSKARDWLAGDEAFHFGAVQSIDSEGKEIDTDYVAVVPSNWESDMLVRLEGNLEAPAVAVHSFDSVKRLKFRISAALNVALLQLQLIFAGQLLDDNSKILHTLGFLDGSTVHVVLKHVKPEDAYKPLSQEDNKIVNTALDRIRAVALEIRAKLEGWTAARQQRKEAADEHVAGAMQKFKDDTSLLARSFGSVWGREVACVKPELRAMLYPQTDQAPAGSPTAGLSRSRTAGAYLEAVNPGQPERPPLVVALLALLSSMTQGHLAVLHSHQGLSTATAPASSSVVPEEAAAFTELNRAILGMRAAGDEADVDVNELPISWRLDLDWAFPPATRETMECFMGCGCRVFTDEMGAHITESGCDLNIGVVPDNYESKPSQGTSMGGNQAIICDVSSAEVDAEDCELFPKDGVGLLPARAGARYTSIDSGVSRLPEYHQLLEFLHHSIKMAIEFGVAGAAQAAEVLALFDPYKDEKWALDKQHRYWLHRWVKERGVPRVDGSFEQDTPALLMARACDAYADRPAFGIPMHNLVPSFMLPRTSARTVLADAAAVTLDEYDGFAWLRFGDLGTIVNRVACGLVGLGLPGGSVVAICGYNDIEWMVADFAIARAGFVSVGIHTTYTQQAAESVINTAGCVAMLTMQNLVLRGLTDDSRKWCVQSIGDKCPSLTTIVLMDGHPESLMKSSEEAEDCLWTPTQQTASFLEWVANPADESCLPDLYKARGKPYKMLDGTIQDMTTLLFTSGSSGKPKAVVIGVDAFVNDVSGDLGSGDAIFQSTTVSYIPLSHSSDRYKVWEHVVWGGRTAFCFYSAHHWEAHETDKKGAMVKYSSPVAGLFAQIQSVRPTCMSLPPNIWAGLYNECMERASELMESGVQPEEALASGRQHVIQMFGGRMKGAVTGGAPTPKLHLEFAEQLCYEMQCGFANSYGATEAGAITSDGRRLGSKFKEIKMALIDHSKLGFRSCSKPYARGEIVVKSPSLCLGYLGEPEKEREVFLEVSDDKPCPPEIEPPLGNGRWYFSGDLGEVDHTGKLTLIDRVSATCATEGGIVIRPGQLENTVESLKWVQFCTVVAGPEYGDHMLVVLKLAEDDASSTNLEDSFSLDHADASVVDMLTSAEEWKAVSSLVLSQPSGVLAPGAVKVQLLVTPNNWTVENGMLSGELKKRRGVLLAAYKKELVRCYENRPFDKDDADALKQGEGANLRIFGKSSVDGLAQPQVGQGCEIGASAGSIVDNDRSISLKHVLGVSALVLAASALIHSLKSK